LFEHIPEIIEVHSELLNSFNNSSENYADVLEQSLKMFSKRMFPVYTAYCNMHFQRMIVLNRLKSNTNMAHFLIKKGLNVASPILSIRSYLLGPMQRMTYYHEMIKELALTRPQFNALEKDLHGMLVQLKESIRRCENKKLLEDISARIEDWNVRCLP
jgi:hypothetical protein